MAVYYTRGNTRPKGYYRLMDAGAQPTLTMIGLPPVVQSQLVLPPYILMLKTFMRLSAWYPQGIERLATSLFP